MMKRLLFSLLLAIPLLATAQSGPALNREGTDRPSNAQQNTFQDTIYVSNQAKSYLLFDAPVSLADVGNPSLYQVRIEGNSVLVVATRDSVADTPFYAVVGGKPFTGRLIFRIHPQAFYDFRKADAERIPTDPLAPEHQVLARLQTLQTYDELNYASAKENGIRFRLAGIFHDLSTTYLKFKIENHTSLLYQTDFIGFERLKRYKKGFFANDKEAHFPLEPVAEWQVEQVLPYSESYCYYALPLQSLERKEAIVATLREAGAGSSRSVSLKISARLIRRADLY